LLGIRLPDDHGDADDAEMGEPLNDKDAVDRPSLPLPNLDERFSYPRKRPENNPSAQRWESHFNLLDRTQQPMVPLNH
jgi:hypothetical protein